MEAAALAVAAKLAADFIGERGGAFDTEPVVFPPCALGKAREGVEDDFFFILVARLDEQMIRSAV